MTTSHEPTASQASVAQNAVDAGIQAGNIGIGVAIPANTAVTIARQLIAGGTKSR